MLESADTPLLMREHARKFELQARPSFPPFPRLLAHLLCTAASLKLCGMSLADCALFLLFPSRRWPRQPCGVA